MKEKKFKVIARSYRGIDEKIYTLEELLARILNELESKKKDENWEYKVFNMYKVEEIE